MDRKLSAIFYHSNLEGVNIELFLQDAIHYLLYSLFFKLYFLGVVQFFNSSLFNYYTLVGVKKIVFI